MKNKVQKWSVFIGKSMLWSLLLYVIMMLAVNWDDISTTVTGRSKTTIVTNILPGLQGSPVGSPSAVSSNISHGGSAMKKAFSVLTRITKLAVAY